MHFIAKRFNLSATKLSAWCSQNTATADKVRRVLGQNHCRNGKFNPAAITPSA